MAVLGFLRRLESLPLESMVGRPRVPLPPNEWQVPLRMRAQALAVFIGGLRDGAAGRVWARLFTSRVWGFLYRQLWEYQRRGFR